MPAPKFPGFDALWGRPESDRPLRVCIATADIDGPVRNGGIGSTYAALADLLAEAGHDCTVLYLRGRDVDHEDAAFWTAHFAGRGVRFVAAPERSREDRFRKPGHPWLSQSYDMLGWLLDNPTDVVHASEWGAAPYLSLTAKRQGLAFADTTFVVKTSAPWLWSRLEGEQPLGDSEQLAQIHAERRSVELADIVVGGSAYLPRWMRDQGYALPERVHVQPNVLAPRAAPAPERSRPRTPIEEFVFFGRLEERKGVLLFFRAVEHLLLTGRPPPRSVTFLGKPGAPPRERASVPMIDHLMERTRHWPMPVRLETDRSRGEALDYLQGEGRLAVCPSLVENASIALHELMLSNLPFVATDVGGNAELIDQGDRAAALCPPRTAALADLLSEALALGGPAPRLAFDNADNLESWRRFHRILAAEPPPAPSRSSRLPPSIAVCIHADADDDALQVTLDSLAAQNAPPVQIVLASRRPMLPGTSPALTVRQFDVGALDAGEAFDAMIGLVEADYVLLLRAGSKLRPWGLERLGRLAAASAADLLTYAHRVMPSGALQTPGLDGVASSIVETRLAATPLLIRMSSVRSPALLSASAGPAFEDRLLLSAQRAGLRCEMLLDDLGSVRAVHLPERAVIARSKIDASPAELRGLLLHALSQPLAPVPARPRPPGAPTRAVRTDTPPPGPTVSDRLYRQGEPRSAPTEAGPPIERPSRPPRPRLALGRRPRAGEALAAHGYEGWCDAPSDGRVEGWAWRFDDPEQLVELDILVDRRFHRRVRADRPRDDLRRAGVGDGEHGFSVALPAAPSPGPPRRIDVLVSDVGQPLNRSPLYIERQRPRAT